MNSFKERFSNLRKSYMAPVETNKPSHSSIVPTKSIMQNKQTEHTQDNKSQERTKTPSNGNGVLEQNKQNKLPLMRAMVHLNSTFSTESHKHSLRFEQTQIALQNVQYCINMLDAKAMHK